MIDPKPSLSLTIRLSEDQIGFLAYLYPNDDPEDALIKLLDRAKSRAIRKAEEQVRVLHPGQEAEADQESSPDRPTSQADDVTENPVGVLQELCQKQRISMPRYEFEEIPSGFRCTCYAMGLRGTGEGATKKEAKAEAARGVLERMGD